MAVPSFANVKCLPNSNTGEGGNKSVEHKKERGGESLEYDLRRLVGVL